MDQGSVATVSREGNKLLVKRSGITEYLHAPMSVLHCEPDGDTVRYIVAASMGRTVPMIIERADTSSLGVLDALPRRTDPAEVQRTLHPPVRSTIPMSRSVALEIPTVTGWMGFDGHVITICAEEEFWYFLADDPTRPNVLADTLGAEGLTVHLEFADHVQRRVFVPQARVQIARKCLLFLRPDPPHLQTSRTAWEYRIVKNMLATSLAEQLNELGNEGWEVVALTGLDGVITLTGNKLFAVLKRPKRPGTRRQ